MCTSSPLFVFLLLTQHPPTPGGGTHPDSTPAASCARSRITKSITSIPPYSTSIQTPIPTPTTPTIATGTGTGTGSHQHARPARCWAASASARRRCCLSYRWAGARSRWRVLGGGRLGECSGRRGFGFGLGAAGWKMMITGECVRGVGLGCTSLLVVPVCGRFVMNEILGIDEY